MPAQAIMAPFAHGDIGSDAAGNHQCGGVANRGLGNTERHFRAIDNDIDNGCLKGGADIVDVSGGERSNAFGFETNGSFQAGERKIRLFAAEHRARQCETIWIAE